MCGHPGLAEKYKESCSKIRNYCVRTYKGGVYLSSAMLAGKIPNNEIPVQTTKVKVEKGTDTVKFNIDLFMWKDKYK